VPGRIQANGANRAVIGYPPGATRRSRVMVSFPFGDTAAFNRRNPEKLASKRPSPMALAGLTHAWCLSATTTWR